MAPAKQRNAAYSLTPLPTRFLKEALFLISLWAVLIVYDVQSDRMDQTILASKSSDSDYIIRKFNTQAQPEPRVDGDVIAHDGVLFRDHRNVSAAATPVHWNASFCARLSPSCEESALANSRLSCEHRTPSARTRPVLRRKAGSAKVALCP